MSTTPAAHWASCTACGALCCQCTICVEARGVAGLCAKCAAKRRVAEKAAELRAKEGQAR